MISESKVVILFMGCYLPNHATFFATEIKDDRQVSLFLVNLYLYSFRFSHRSSHISHRCNPEQCMTDLNLPTSTYFFILRFLPLTRSVLSLVHYDLKYIKKHCDHPCSSHDEGVRGARG